ncbi:transposase [Marimonas sp. MJW-29]|uniref:Transposase n=1 Tax=Sulfitobacter sediminis TaxID=3234186 RepID=A0ABV3RN47_9RHOB
MPKQPAFPGLRDAMKKKQTRPEKFLAEMNQVVPWTRLLVLIDPHYPKAGPNGRRPPMPLETMLRVHFLQRGNDWYFRMRAHVGVDAEIGIVRSLETTTAKVHDSQVWDDLLHSKETSVWADKGYVSATRGAAFSDPGKFWGAMRKAPKGGALHPIGEDIKRIIARVWARVEHPFRVLKRQFGYLKTRYRGLAKNRAQLFTLFAIGNLFLV